MANEKNNNFLFFILGSLVGVILGLLFAPQKGSDTRKKVNEVFSNLKKFSKDKIKETKKAVNDMYEDGKDFIFEDDDDKIDSEDK
jgi:gas vesicle protein